MARTLLYTRISGANHKEEYEYRMGIFGFQMYSIPDTTGSYWWGAEECIESLEDYPLRFEHMSSEFIFKGYGNHD